MDEGDFKWVGNEKNVLLLLNQLHEHVRSKPPVLRKLSHFSEMQIDALIHREGLKGSGPGDSKHHFVYLKTD